MDVSEASKRGFFTAIGRRRGDYIRFVIEIVLIVKVVTGDLPVEALIGVL